MVDLLELNTAPIAVTCHASQPHVVSRVEKIKAFGCTDRRRASGGRTFNSKESDHQQCQEDI